MNLILEEKNQLHQNWSAKHSNWGFPNGSVVTNLPARQETQERWVGSVGWEDALEEGMATHSSVVA